jgi:hypothetical protein
MQVFDVMSNVIRNPMGALERNALLGIKQIYGPKALC